MREIVGARLIRVEVKDLEVVVEAERDMDLMLREQRPSRSMGDRMMLLLQDIPLIMRKEDKDREEREEYRKWRLREREGRRRGGGRRRIRIRRRIL